MAVFKNLVAIGTTPMPAVLDNNITAQRLVFKPTANLAANDFVELGILPAGARLVDMVIDSDALTGGTISTGFYNAGKTDLDATASGGVLWMPAQAIGTAGATRADGATLRAFQKIAKSDVDRTIVAKAIAATTAFSGLEFGVTVYYRQDYQ
jgi:hypothetical protein